MRTRPAHYRVFGGCLRSDIEFAELQSLPSEAADWILRVGELPAPEGGALLGEEQLVDAVGARLYRAHGSFRLSFDDTGTFEVDDGGRTIIWAPAPNARVEIARADVL